VPGEKEQEAMAGPVITILNARKEWKGEQSKKKGNIRHKQSRREKEGNGGVEKDQWSQNY